MKTFIFADYTPAMTHYEIMAHSSAEAIRLLVERHGARAYRIVNIIGGVL